MTPTEQHDALSALIRRAEKTDAARCIWVEPEHLFGFDANPDWPGLDLAQYDKKGYPHPREQAFYSRTSSRIQELVDGLTISGDTDPIETYLDRDLQRLIVLDGASRCAAISIIRQSNPDAFKRIRTFVRKGPKEEALARMVAANMGDRRTELSLPQIARTVKRWMDWGWTKEEVCERLGKPDSWKAKLGSILRLNEADPLLLAAIEEGRISNTDALDMANQAPGIQRDQLTSGKPITKASIRKAKRSAAQANGRTLPGPKLQPWKKLDNAADYIAKEFDDWLEQTQPDELECIVAAKQRAFTALNELANLIRPEVTR